MVAVALSQAQSVGELLGLILGPDGLSVLPLVVLVRRPQGGLHQSSRYEISSKRCS